MILERGSEAPLLSLRKEMPLDRVRGRSPGDVGVVGPCCITVAFVGNINARSGAGWVYEPVEIMENGNRYVQVSQ